PRRRHHRNFVSSLELPPLALSDIFPPSFSMMQKDMEESARLLEDGCETETHSSSGIVPQFEQPQQENWPNFANNDIMRQHSDIQDAKAHKLLSDKALLFLEQLDNALQGHDDSLKFCKSSVEPMGEESDHVHIIALLDALGFPIRVVYLDRSSCDTGEVTVNHHDFVPASTGDPPKVTKDTNKPFITLLYRPGHYDILYPK
ncbi:unnamed protein product, partial [Linum tenue]